MHGISLRAISDDFFVSLYLKLVDIFDRLTLVRSYNWQYLCDRLHQLTHLPRYIYMYFVASSYVA